MENLRRKQKKEKQRAQHMKSSHDTERMHLSKLSINSRFVEQLSIKTIQESIFQSPGCFRIARVRYRQFDQFHPEDVQSKRLLAMGKDHVLQERNLQKYHEIVFLFLEKTMCLSQSNQMKMLRVRMIKNYLGWQTVRTFTPYLSKVFRNAFKRPQKALLESEGGKELY
ncbi:Hypothetical protein CINCED_3A006441 [Cinara cedri]|uniref:Uncharacterized protein n=1 Tax=Cinara cedri TaxID=506608 RepID=A0A5E4MYF0_9HEMI|nr:Hypothetical protein CINCED_3A006441 [Cinara cedri]